MSSLFDRANSVDIVSLAQELGYELKKAGNEYKTRLRANDKTPSCSIVPDGNFFYDFGDTSLGSSPVDLVMHRYGWDKTKAAKWLVGEDDEPAPNLPPVDLTALPEPEPVTVVATREQLGDSIDDLYRLRPDMVDWLFARGIDETAISLYGIGLWHEWGAQWIGVPTLDEDNNAISLKLRRDPFDTGSTFDKYMTRGKGAGVYGLRDAIAAQVSVNNEIATALQRDLIDLDQAQARQGKLGYLFVVETEFDANAINVALLPLKTASAIARAHLNSLSIADLAPFQRIIYVMDIDDNQSGKKKAQDFARKFGVGRVVITDAFGEHDIGDLFRLDYDIACDWLFDMAQTGEYAGGDHNPTSATHRQVFDAFLAFDIDAGDYEFEGLKFTVEISPVTDDDLQNLKG